MKIKDMLPLIEPLKSIQELKIKGSLSFKIQRFISKFDAELNEFNQQRNKILKEYGEEQDDGQFIIPEDKIEEFNAEMKEMGEVEVDLTLPEIKEEDLNLDSVEIEPAKLAGIELLIKD